MACLGIADEKERRLSEAECAVKDAVLHGVRVLELVDQSRPVPGAEGPGQPIPSGASKGRVNVSKQVVKGLDVSGGLSSLDLGTGLVKDRDAKPQERSLERAGKGPSTMKGALRTGRRRDGRAGSGLSSSPGRARRP